MKSSANNMRRLACWGVLQVCKLQQQPHVRAPAHHCWCAVLGLEAEAYKGIAQHTQVVEVRPGAQDLQQPELHLPAACCLTTHTNTHCHAAHKERCLVAGLSIVGYKVPAAAGNAPCSHTMTHRTCSYIVHLHNTPTPSLPNNMVILSTEQLHTTVHPDQHVKACWGSLPA